MFFLAVPGLNAQQKDPVSWTTSYKALSNGEGEISITGKIDKGWHIYSQRPTDAGPIPTSFTLVPSAAFERLGDAVEEGSQEEFDKAFDAKIFVFNERAVFRQKIKVKGKPGFVIPVKLEYMSCNDMMCLPPKVIELSVKTQ
jgi:thiol:disulfide interchange protein DsbD